MSIKRGLGRNLSALLQTTTLIKETSPTPTQGMLQMVSIGMVQPGKYQPRLVWDESALLELAQSIKKQGLLQPVVVRATEEGRYEIIAGERRWRACQMAECTELPVLVQQVDDETAMAMALVENLQRESLNAMDQARAMKRLFDEFHLTHQEIADLLSKSRAAVSNFLRLLQLDREVQTWIESGQLEMGHGRCVLGLEPQHQVSVARLALEKGWSVRATEAWVKRLKEQNDHSQYTTQLATPIFQDEILALSHRLNAKISLRSSVSGKGTLRIHYEGLDALKQVMEKLQ